MLAFPSKGEIDATVSLISVLKKKSNCYVEFFDHLFTNQYLFTG